MNWAVGLDVWRKTRTRWWQRGLVLLLTVSLAMAPVQREVQAQAPTALQTAGQVAGAVSGVSQIATMAGWTTITTALAPIMP